MKKISCVLTLLLILSLLFSGCTNTNKGALATPTIEGEYPEGDYEEAMGIDGELDFPTFSKLLDFLSTSDPYAAYGSIVSIAIEDKVAIKPLISGVDESLNEGHARIVISPSGEDDELAKIIYYYPDTLTNYVFTVYYLTDTQLAVATEKGVAGILNYDSTVLETSSMGNYTIVKNTVTQESYAEILVTGKYLIKVNGAPKNTDNYYKLIDEESLNKVVFEVVEFY